MKRRPSSQKSSPRAVPKKRKAGSEACAMHSAELPHSDHAEFLPRLRRVQGQLTGIEKMITEQRYCVDLLVQFRAVMAALRSVEVSVFEKHLKHCVSSALHSKNPAEIDRKILELTELLTRRTSL